MKQAGFARLSGGALLALTLALAPALAATTQWKAKKQQAHAGAPSMTLGGFTPAVADPKLAAAFAARGLEAGSFRFTPSTNATNGSKAVKVAVRARATRPVEMAHAANVPPTQVNGLTPASYNLGAAVGWRRFALSGDVAKVESGVLPNGREAAEVGISYAGNKFTGRVQVGAERSDHTPAKALAREDSYSLDLGGSYSIARNLALTGGVRYKIQRDRLQPLADERRDSQSVYVGTAFRF